MYISIIVVLAILSLALVLSLGMIPSVNASDINCEEKSNDEHCNGERGKLGMIYCDLLELGADDCYDRESRIDCNEKPEHKWCTGEEGIDGWEYCDLKTDRKDCKDRT